MIRPRSKTASSDATPEGVPSGRITPLIMRTEDETEHARCWPRWLHECDLTETEVAQAIGRSQQTVSTWGDHKRSDGLRSPRVTDVVRMPRPVAQRVLEWMAGKLGFVLVDAVKVDGMAQTHRRHLATVIRQAATFTAAYADALDDDVIDPSEARVLKGEIACLRRDLDSLDFALSAVVTGSLFHA